MVQVASMTGGPPAYAAARERAPSRDVDRHRRRPAAGLVGVFVAAQLARADHRRRSRPFRSASSPRPRPVRRPTPPQPPTPPPPPPKAPDAGHRASDRLAHDRAAHGARAPAGGPGPTRASAPPSRAAPVQRPGRRGHHAAELHRRLSEESRPRSIRSAPAAGASKGRRAPARPGERRGRPEPRC